MHAYSTLFRPPKAVSRSMPPSSPPAPAAPPRPTPFCRRPVRATVSPPRSPSDILALRLESGHGRGTLRLRAVLAHALVQSHGLACRRPADRWQTQRVRPLGGEREHRPPRHIFGGGRASAQGGARAAAAVAVGQAANYSRGETSHPGWRCGCQRSQHDRWQHPLRSCDFLGPPVVMSVPALAKGGGVAGSEQGTGTPPRPPPLPGTLAARAQLSASKGQPRASGWAPGAELEQKVAAWSRTGAWGGCAPTQGGALSRAARAIDLAKGGHGGVVLRARLGLGLEGFLGRDNALAVELAHRLLLHAA